MAVVCCQAKRVNQLEAGERGKSSLSLVLRDCLPASCSLLCR